MAKKAGIPNSIDNWESGALGRDKAHAKRADKDLEAAIEDSLGLQMISIRLPKNMIDTCKLLAAYHGVGYQPLIRDAICRWAEGELKQVLIRTLAERDPKADGRNDDEPIKQAA